MWSTPAYLIIFSLITCNESNPLQKTPTANHQTLVNKSKSITKVKQQNNGFAGTYSVVHQGGEIVINLTSKAELVSGTFVMNGQQAKINGMVKNQICTGKIIEDQTGKTYDFVCDRKADLLNFSFTVPEQQNQVVKLVLKKETNQNGIAKQNPLLFGTWRNTEVLSSGSGALYTSFATDYFVKLSADGTALLWTGKSAGGSNGITIDGAKAGTIQRLAWYTEGKLLYLVNPITKAKSAVSFYAEQNRMMLTSGNNKKVYQRVN